MNAVEAYRKIEGRLNSAGYPILNRSGAEIRDGFAQHAERLSRPPVRGATETCEEAELLPYLLATRLRDSLAKDAYIFGYGVLLPKHLAPFGKQHLFTLWSGSLMTDPLR